MRFAFITFTLSIAVTVIFPAVSFCAEPEYIETVIDHVVYETENGYVATGGGAYRLPDVSSMIEMDRKPYELLISNLISLTGNEVGLFVTGNVIVGVESKELGLSFRPPFAIRKKVVYAVPPTETETTLLGWDADTYRLSVYTDLGTFCVHDHYVYSDYYEKVHGKLTGVCGMSERVRVGVRIKYHAVEDGYECLGEIEDIELVE